MQKPDKPVFLCLQCLIEKFVTQVSSPPEIISTTHTPQSSAMCTENPKPHGLCVYMELIIFLTGKKRCELKPVRLRLGSTMTLHL